MFIVNYISFVISTFAQIQFIARIQTNDIDYLYCIKTFSIYVTNKVYAYTFKCDLGIYFVINSEIKGKTT